MDKGFRRAHKNHPMCLLQMITMKCTKYNQQPVNECAVTDKDCQGLPCFYQTSSVPTCVRQETGVTLTFCLFLNTPDMVFCLPVLRRKLFGNWNPEVFLQCDMALLLDSRICETYSILRIGCCVSDIKVHEENRLVSLDSLLREAPLERMREGYLHNHG